MEEQYARDEASAAARARSRFYFEWPNRNSAHLSRKGSHLLFYGLRIRHVSRFDSDRYAGAGGSESIISVAESDKSGFETRRESVRAGPRRIEWHRAFCFTREHAATQSYFHRARRSQMDEPARWCISLSIRAIE